MYDCLTPSPRYVSLTENSKNNITLRRLEPMISVSLKISLELVHLTTTPIIHISFIGWKLINTGSAAEHILWGF